MSHRRSKEKERNWSPIRLPGDGDRKVSRRHYRSSESDREHKDKKHKIIKLNRYETRDEQQTRSRDDSSSRWSKSSKDKVKRKITWREEEEEEEQTRDLEDTEPSSHRSRKHSSSTSLKRRHRDAEVSDDDERGARSSKRRRRERSRSEDLDESLELVIIGKSRNAGQFCVLGYDGNHIYRPVNFSTGSLFWQVDRFEVGKMYRFFLNGDDRSFKKLSSHPHRFNDINVTDHAESIHDREKAKSLIEKLRNNAKTHMDFQDVMERKFVVEDTECPSACLYRCSARDVELYRSRIGKQRVSVAGFDFPFAGVYSDIRKTFDDYDRNAVVVLSLTRPFGGFSDRVFNPKRCYILVVGVHSY